MDFLLLLTRIILVFVGCSCVSSLPTQDLDYPWLAQSDQSVHPQPGSSSLVDPILDEISIVPYRVIPTEPDIQLVGAEPSNQPSQDVVGFMTTSDQNSPTPEDEDVNFISCSEGRQKNTKGASYLDGTNTGSFCPRLQLPEELGNCKTKWFLRCSGPKYGKLIINVKGCKPIYDSSPPQLSGYRSYCCNDIGRVSQSTWELTGKGCSTPPAPPEQPVQHGAQQAEPAFTGP